MKEQKVIAEVEATEGRHSVFGIFRNGNSPCENDMPIASIELKQAVYIGGDLYVIPLQVYETDNPVTLKLVYLVSDLYFRGEKQFGELRENNIRAGKMTRDGKLIHRHPGERDMDGENMISSTSSRSTRSKTKRFPTSVSGKDGLQTETEYSTSVSSKGTAKALRSKN